MIFRVTNFMFARSPPLSHGIQLACDVVALMICINVCRLYRDLCLATSDMHPDSICQKAFYLKHNMPFLHAFMNLLLNACFCETFLRLVFVAFVNSKI